MHCSIARLKPSFRLCRSSCWHFKVIVFGGTQGNEVVECLHLEEQYFCDQSDVDGRIAAEADIRKFSLVVAFRDEADRSML